MLILKLDSKEWDYMLTYLNEHPINEGRPFPTPNDEIKWKYMGTYRHNGKVLHDFLHKNHPMINEEKKLVFSASKELRDEDIEKIIPIK